MTDKTKSQTEDKDLIKQLYDEMTRQSLTISELSRRTGLNRSHLSEILHQQHRPQLNSLQLIAHALGGEISFLPTRKFLKKQKKS